MSRSPRKMAVSARLRRLWLDVHLWLGVGLLVVLVPLGLSGSALVWHDPIDRALHAERYAVSGPDARLPVAAYAEAAQGAFAGRAMLSQIRLPQKAGDPVVAVGRINGPVPQGARPRSLNAWIDPPTGRVLGTADVSQGMMMVLHRLHGTLMIPQIGRKIVGWLGWGLFLSSATGLWLWWPRNGAVLKALRWRRGPSTLFNLHHMAGFWICLPLSIVSLTGVYISFPQTSRALFGVAQPQQGPRPAARPAPAAPLANPTQDIEAAVTAARYAAAEQVRGARLAAVNLPTEGRRPAWRVDFARPASPEQAKAAGRPEPLSIRVDDATGRARSGPDPERAGARGAVSAAPARPDAVSPLMRRIHDGNEMGLVWQVIVFLTGVAPTLLGATGLVMWLRRRARRRALHAPEPQGAAANAGHTPEILLR